MKLSKKCFWKVEDNKLLTPEGVVHLQHDDKKMLRVFCDRLNQEMEEGYKQKFVGWLFGDSEKEHNQMLVDTYKNWVV